MGQPLNQINEEDDLDRYMFYRLFQMALDTDEVEEQEGDEDEGPLLFLDSGFCYNRPWVERIVKRCPQPHAKDIKTLLLKGANSVKHYDRLYDWWINGGELVV